MSRMNSKTGKQDKARPASLPPFTIFFLAILFFPGNGCAITDMPRDNELDPKYSLAEGLGACVDDILGGCREEVDEDDCFGETFHEGKTCAEVDPTGACVNDIIGGCDDSGRQSDCDDTFYEGQTCAEADPSGACVNTNTDTCSIRDKADCLTTPWNNFQAGGTCP